MPRRPTRGEVEGFLAGVEHLRDLKARAGHPVDEAAGLLVRAREEVARGELAEAEATLVKADAALRRLEEEPELSEFPRGLVGYVPRGARGAPTAREEEPVANRLLLVNRLLQVRRAQGHDVDRLLPRLQEAEAAYARGDRLAARRLGDLVLGELERMGARPGGPGPAPEP